MTTVVDELSVEELQDKLRRLTRMHDAKKKEVAGYKIEVKRLKAQNQQLKLAILQVTHLNHNEYLERCTEKQCVLQRKLLDYAPS
jgi:hypothetical protein